MVSVSWNCGPAASHCAQPTHASTSVTSEAPRAIGLASAALAAGRAAMTTAPTSGTTIIKVSRAAGHQFITHRTPRTATTPVSIVRA